MALLLVAANLLHQVKGLVCFEKLLNPSSTLTAIETDMKYCFAQCEKEVIVEAGGSPSIALCKLRHVCCNSQKCNNEFICEAIHGRQNVKEVEGTQTTLRRPMREKSLDVQSADWYHNYSTRFWETLRKIREKAKLFYDGYGEAASASALRALNASFLFQCGYYFLSSPSSSRCSEYRTFGSLPVRLP